MENGLRDNTENGPGKSIVFARNHIHAELLGKLFQEMYPEFGPNYCAVIDNYNPRAEQLIDDFKTPGSDPVIAVSVDMLDTGIDVPEVLNLVFAKPVKSYVKFWQMIGRGTRLCKTCMAQVRTRSDFTFLTIGATANTSRWKGLKKSPRPANHFWSGCSRRVLPY